MKNITYFLGAGASYHAIPLVKGDPEKGRPSINEDMTAMFKEISSYIERFVKKSQDTHVKPISDYKLLDQQIFQEISTAIQLIETSYSHSTIDTFAKRLSTTDRQKYEKLKNYINAYLCLIQLYRRDNTLNLSSENISFNIDERYIGLLASFIRKDANLIRISKEIKFITWNYDFQLQLAFSLFDPECKSYIDSMLKSNTYTELHLDNIKASQIINLNGIAGLLVKKESNEIIRLAEISGLPLKSLIRYINQYIFMNDAYSSPIYFSWDEVSNARIKKAHNVIKNSRIIVVIGYSFPFFNRSVDRKLLNKSTLSKCEKIYVQDPKFDKDSFMAQFDLSSISEKIIEVGNNPNGLQSFFIPHEL